MDYLQALGYTDPCLECGYFDGTCIRTGDDFRRELYPLLKRVRARRDSQPEGAGIDEARIPEQILIMCDTLSGKLLWQCAQMAFHDEDGKLVDGWYWVTPEF